MIPPHCGLANLTFVAAYDPYAILMTLFDVVGHDARLVVVDLNPHEIELHLIALNVSIDIEVCSYSGAPAEGNSVLDYVWLG